jgi:HlyD family secretion protein
VAIATAKRATVTRLVSAAGHLQAVQTVKVSSNVTGDLIALNVREGQRVKRGQLLGQIDRRAYEGQVQQFQAAVGANRAQLDQIAASIEQDERDLARIRRIVAEKLASASEQEKAETLLKQDRSRLAAQLQLVASNQGQLDSARYSLSRTTLVAPLDGTVLELNHKVGERIRGSDFSEDVVLLMGDLEQMEVKAEVGEHEVVAIREGDPATIEVDALPDHPFKGRVSAVGRNALVKNAGTDAEVTTFYIRVTLLDPTVQVLPGMSTAVSISTATKENVVTVPIQAVTAREPKKKERGPALEGQLKPQNPAAGQEPQVAAGKAKPVKAVFVVKDGKVALREVKTGIASRTDVEIVEGLSDGERVVEGPYRTLARELQDGQAIKELERDKDKAGKPGAAGSPSSG